MTADLERFLGRAECRVHTALVDEAGCMEEISMAVILKLRPENIILIGQYFLSQL
jgi:hypothetical protein